MLTFKQLLETPMSIGPMDQKRSTVGIGGMKRLDQLQNADSYTLGPAQSFNKDYNVHLVTATKGPTRHFAFIHKQTGRIGGRITGLETKPNKLTITFLEKAKDHKSLYMSDMLAHAAKSHHLEGDSMHVPGTDNAYRRLLDYKGIKMHFSWPEHPDKKKVAATEANFYKHIGDPKSLINISKRTK